MGSEGIAMIHSETEPEKPTEAEVEKRVYGIDEIRALREKASNEVSGLKYKVIYIRHSSRSSTPVAFHPRDNSNNNYHRLSSRSASPMIFYTAGEMRPCSRSATPLFRKPVEFEADRESNVLQRSKSPEELMDYYHDDPSTLPQGDITGRIQWMHQNNGRIRTIGRVLASRDLFFHFNDVELKEGQVLDVGDRVVFTVSIYKNLVCATHIRKMEPTRSKSTLAAQHAHHIQQMQDTQHVQHAQQMQETQHVQQMQQMQQTQ